MSRCYKVYSSLGAFCAWHRFNYLSVTLGVSLLLPSALYFSNLARAYPLFEDMDCFLYIHFSYLYPLARREGVEFWRFVGFGGRIAAASFFEGVYCFVFSGSWGNGWFTASDTS